MARVRAILVILGCLIAVPSFSAPVAKRVRLPGSAMADPDGALSPGVNPAGLALPAGLDARLVLATGGAKVLDTRGAGWGLYAAAPLGALSLGGALEHNADPDAAGGSPEPYVLSRATIGLGLALSDRVALGGTLVSQGHAGAEADWSGDVGALLRPWSWLSLAGRVRQLGTGGDDAATKSLPTEWGWGVAVRPLGSNRLTAAVDFAWPVGGKRSELSLLLDGKVVQGVHLRAQLSDFRNDLAPADDRQESRILVGLQWDMGRFGAQAAVHGDRNAHQDRPGFVAVLRASGDVLPGPLMREAPAVSLKLEGAASERPDGGVHFPGLLLALQELADRQAHLVVIQARGFELDWAQVEELRDAIASLRRAGKRVVWYGDDLGTRTLAVAAACDRIALPPGGTLSAHGVGSNFIGLQATLEKIGVEFQSIRFGAHKTAGDQFTRAAASPELESQLKRLVERRWTTFTAAVSAGRDLTPTAVEDAIAQGIAYPEDALAARLVDAVVQPEALVAQLQAWHLLEIGQDLASYTAPTLRRTRWGKRAQVDVIAVDGTIVNDKSGTGPLSSRVVGGREMAETIDKSAGGDTRALVVRIASPGGTLLGSDLMFDALRRAREKKPVIASMAAVAASGGYWLSLGADHVLADRGTVTGSIGVISLKPSLRGLHEKTGLGVQHFGVGPGSEIESLHRPWTDTEVALLDKILGRYYGLFLERTAQRRGLDHTALGPLAEGRIWLGDEAAAGRLVDGVGGFLPALREAKTRAGIDDDDEPARLRWLPEVSVMDAFRKQLGVDAEAVASEFAAVAQTVAPWVESATLLGFMRANGGLALLPLDVRDSGK
jgi:protease-4